MHAESHNGQVCPQCSLMSINPSPKTRTRFQGMGSRRNDLATLSMKQDSFLRVATFM
jgi:hypothetical protein